MNGSQGSRACAGVSAVVGPSRGGSGSLSVLAVLAGTQCLELLLRRLPPGGLRVGMRAVGPVQATRLHSSAAHRLEVENVQQGTRTHETQDYPSGTNCRALSAPWGVVTAALRSRANGKGCPGAIARNESQESRRPLGRLSLCLAKAGVSRPSGGAVANRRGCRANWRVRPSRLRHFRVWL
jgi:hypothetical protein